MTDITDQDRRTAIDVAQAIERGDYPMAAMWPIMARVILATVDAPEPTLADEIRGLPDFTMSGENCINDCHERADTLATRVAQVEHDLAEARAEVERLTTERDEATVAREANVAPDLPDPADVKPGEAWLVRYHSETLPALRRIKVPGQWDIVRTHGAGGSVRSQDITLVSRLVPAPRVITNAEDLDRLCPNSVILSADNDAWQKSTRTILWSSPWWDASHGGPAMWPSERLCDEDHPVTVLWEPGV